MPSLLIRLCCLLLIVSFHDGVAAVDEDEFIYNGFAGSDLLLDGAASVTQDGALVLARSWSYKDNQGHGFHPKALPFVSSDGMATNFSATFVFAITPSHSGYSGDGMAFVISLAPLSDGWPGKYLGLNNPYDYYPPSANRFFAIELDTVANKELGDIDDNHVGIDLKILNNLTSARSSTAGFHSGSHFNPLSLSSGNPMQVWVDYFVDQVEVRLASVPMYKPSSPLAPVTTWYKPSSPLLTYNSLDLAKVLKNGTKSKSGVPTMAYVGFSAATGDTIIGTHQVLGWSFSMSGSAKPLNLSLLLSSQQARDSSRREAHDKLKKKLVKWLPAVVSLAAILAVAGIAAWLLLRWRCRIRNSEWNEDWEAELGPRRFAYKDLRRAINGFHDNQLLGKGGFGRVYGGALAGSGVRVAVKRISSESRQGPGWPSSQPRSSSLAAYDTGISSA